MSLNKLLSLAFALIGTSALAGPVLMAQIFAPAVNYTVGLRPYTIVSADFDKDGDFDLATAPAGAFASDGIGWVKVLMNNGKGVFTITDSVVVGDAPCLEAADLDADGDIDIVASDFYTATVYILINDGTGKFAVARSFPSGRKNYTNSMEPAVADLDGDGDFDLAVPIWISGTATDSVSIFFNNGNATFSGPVLYPVANNPYKVISADIDHDGDSDLVVSNNGSLSVSVLLNNGNGTFASHVDYAVRQLPQGLSLADYNGDGHLDLAVANTYTGTWYVSVFMGKGDGTFGSRVDYDACAPHAIASTDYDGDGDIDMAVADNECNSLSIFLNNGDGTFASQFQLPTGTGTNHIVAKDFNGDGKFDLALENFDNNGSPGNTVSVFINQTMVSVRDESVIPEVHSLQQNYPNPFNPATTITFSLRSKGFTELKIYDVLGRDVATLISKELNPGEYQAAWDARGFGSGIYFYRLTSGTLTETKKLVLLR